MIAFHTQRPSTMTHRVCTSLSPGRKTSQDIHGTGGNGQGRPHREEDAGTSLPNHPAQP